MCMLEGILVYIFSILSEREFPTAHCLVYGSDVSWRFGGLCTQVMHAHEQITCTTMATWNFTLVRCQNHKGHTMWTKQTCPACVVLLLVELELVQWSLWDVCVCVHACVCVCVCVCVHGSKSVMKLNRRPIIICCKTYMRACLLYSYYLVIMRSLTSQ